MVLVQIHRNVRNRSAGLEEVMVDHDSDFGGDFVKVLPWLFGDEDGWNARRRLSRSVGAAQVGHAD